MNCLYEVVMVPMSMYRAEARSIQSAERRKMNVLRMCLRSFVGMLRMDGVRNEEVYKRAGIETK